MEENSDYFQQLFGENYTSEVRNDIQEMLDNIESANLLSTGGQQQQEEPAPCPTKRKKKIVADPPGKSRDFKKLFSENLSVSAKRKKMVICLTLDNENYDFYNRIAEKSNIKLQRVLNLALLCFQENLQDS